MKDVTGVEISTRPVSVSGSDGKRRMRRRRMSAAARRRTRRVRSMVARYQSFHLLIVDIMIVNL